MDNDKSRVITQLATYLNKKLKPDQVDQMVRQLRGVPVQFLETYCMDLIDNLPPATPGRFPSIQSIRNAYAKQTAPSDYERAHKPQTACDTCTGDGLIWYRVFEPLYNRDAEYCARCGDCENYKRHDGAENYPELTNARIVERGLIVWRNGKY
jgi:hypothetical protein